MGEMWLQRAVGHVFPQIAMCSQQRLLVGQEGRYRNEDSSGGYPTLVGPVAEELSYGKDRHF